MPRPLRQEVIRGRPARGENGSLSRWGSCPSSTRKGTAGQASSGPRRLRASGIREGSLYGVNDSGIAFRFDAATGKEIWKKRLGGGFSASPVWAAGRLYACSEQGKTFVFQAGTAAYEEVAVNELPEGIMSTPAICGGRIYLRTEGMLYCLGGR